MQLGVQAGKEYLKQRLGIYRLYHHAIISIFLSLRQEQSLSNWNVWKLFRSWGLTPGPPE